MQDSDVKSPINSKDISLASCRLTGMPPSKLDSDGIRQKSPYTGFERNVCENRCKPSAGVTSHVLISHHNKNKLATAYLC